jgi:acyl-CoA reductase-like NAD-dependent aldehyde dehydrogenase
MNLTERIKVLTQLGRHLSQKDDYLEAVMHRSMHHNGWFTLENQQQAVEAIRRNFLDEQKLRQWIEKYDIPEETPSIKNVGIVMAGNIPLVGFHDLVSVFLSGHRAMIKMSDKDPYLLPYLLKLLGQFDERTKAYFQLVDRLKDFDAVIATGSNNSSRYFDHYFSKFPISSGKTVMP